MLKTQFPPTPSAKRAGPLLAAFTLLGILAGCVHPIEGDSPLGEGSGEARIYQRGGKLEVRAFQGGYGSDFYQQAAKEYQARHPGVTIDVKADPRIWEQLRPQFIAGEPPALAFPGWGMDHYSLIYERQALPLDDVLLTTPYGETSGTWRDTFYPDILKEGEYQGQTYLLPFYINLNGWWYNVRLFEENGWNPPRTWTELLSLCEKIK